MIISYLEKLKSKYIREKLDAEKKLNELEMHLRENIEFIKLLEETNDPNYELFTPREVNVKNKAKIFELGEKQKDIRIEIQQQKNTVVECKEKLDELMYVLSEAKKTRIEEDIENEPSEFYRLMLLEIQENERQRISRELHDYTVQNLTSLVHRTELCSKLVDMDSVRCKLELGMMSKTLRDIIDDTRKMIYNLHPMSFDDIGLDITIERALDKLESSEHKKIKFLVEGQPYQIKSVIGITLLRIIQEGCSNAIQHAECSWIKVVLTYHSDKILIQIEDDGKGFDTSKINMTVRDDNSGFGLSMMRERIYLLSGNIKIESKLDYGTKIFVSIPIQR